MTRASRLRSWCLCFLVLVLGSSTIVVADDDHRQVALLPAAASQMPNGTGAAILPAVPVAQLPTVNDGMFALGPGDGIKITVWGYPELSEDAVILPDGTLSYPLIGTLSADGLTAQGLAKSISQALEAHIPVPQVSVMVKDMRSRHFSIMGGVKTAGVYPIWNGGVTILEALAQAGGFADDALPSQVRLFRHGADASSPETIDVASLLAGHLAEVPVVHSGDVINVASQAHVKKICVLGDVNLPGLYALTSDMTVIDALSAAGWVKPSGVITSVMLARRDEQGKTEFFRVNAKRAVEKQDWTQHLLLQPGDIVYVPRQFFAKVGDFVSFFSDHVEPAAHAYLRVYDATNPANVVVDR